MEKPCEERVIVALAVFFSRPDRMARYAELVGLSNFLYGRDVAGLRLLNQSVVQGLGGKERSEKQEKAGQQGPRKGAAQQDRLTSCMTRLDKVSAAPEGRVIDLVRIDGGGRGRVARNVTRKYGFVPQVPRVAWAGWRLTYLVTNICLPLANVGLLP